MLADVSGLMYPQDVDTILDMGDGETIDLTKLKQEILDNVEVIQSGVYIGSLNLDSSIDYLIKEDYPEDLGIYCYGVCDIPEQVLWKSNIVHAERVFVVFCTPIEKDIENKRKGGGWRWHKWGPYIGEQNGPTTEYLDDEPEIDLVYVYHIKQLDPYTLGKARRLQKAGKLTRAEFCKHHNKYDLCGIKE